MLRDDTRGLSVMQRNVGSVWQYWLVKPKKLLARIKRTGDVEWQVSGTEGSMAEK